MKHYFKPDYYVRNFENIDIQRLKKQAYVCCFVISTILWSLITTRIRTNE